MGSFNRDRRVSLTIALPMSVVAMLDEEVDAKRKSLSAVICGHVLRSLEARARARASETARVSE